MKGTWLVSRLIDPRSLDEDTRRKEFILNTLLLCSVVLSGMAVLLVLEEFLTFGSAYRGTPLHNPIGVFALFLSLYLLARGGFRVIATHALIGLYLASGGYALYHWGVDLPTGLLICTLVILIAGILVTIRFSLIITLVCMALLAILAYLQIHGIIVVQDFWRSEPLQMGNVIVIMILFGVASIVSWLSNRETEKSLRRAWQSEKALLHERDQLEQKVEERSNELKRAQMEKMVDLYHQADFGRLAVGLLHDLATPLNVVLLNLEQLQANSSDHVPVRSLIERAMRGTKSMEHFVETIRHQIHQKETKRSFGPLRSIKQVIWFLAARAEEVGVTINLTTTLPPTCRLFGNPVKFQQLITNLLVNAIDACQAVGRSDHQITVDLTYHNDSVHLTLTDTGCGIEHTYLEKIFEPFFTTKPKGTGIGLSISRDIIEKEFKGTITVTSTPPTGTIFNVTIPTTKI